MDKLQNVNDDPMGGFVSAEPQEDESEKGDLKETVVESETGQIPDRLKGLHRTLAERTLLFTKQCEAEGKREGIDLKVEVKISYG